MPSTNPSRSRLSKNRKPCTSSTTVIAPAIALEACRPARSRHPSTRRGCGTTGRPGWPARWCGPSSATNGCSSAGLGPGTAGPTHRSQSRRRPRAAWWDRESRSPAPVPRCRERIVHGLFAAVVDRRDQENGRGRRGRQDRLRLNFGHGQTPSVHSRGCCGENGQHVPARTACAVSSTRHRRRSTSVSPLRSGCVPPVSPSWPSDAWPGSGRFFTVRAGSLVAWRSEEPGAPFRIVGGHTDSPSLRVKQHPDRFVSGWQVVALQPYGGAWLNSWLDRDLGISGRLSLRCAARPAKASSTGWSGSTTRSCGCRSWPSGRGPKVGVAGSAAPRQRGLGRRQRDAVVLGYVAEAAGVDAADVLGADLMTTTSTPSTLAGADDELVSAPRLDNQATCYAGLEAFRLPPRPGHIGPCWPCSTMRSRLAIGSRCAVRTACDRAGTHRAGRRRRS